MAFAILSLRWNGAALPIGLGAVGLPGCQLWIQPWGSMLVAHGGTSANVSLGIPANPVLAGLVLPLQALVFDAAAANGIGAVSNAGVMRIH